MYNALPTVATGDTWTAANHNTYIRDNFAAGVPDIFTTKGDLAVASGANAASRLGVGTNNQVLMADSAEALGLKFGNSVVFTSRLQNTGWDGDTIGIGTTTIAANTFNAGLPNTARGLLLALSAKWTGAGDGNTCNIRTPGITGNGVLVRAQVANQFQDNFGIVPLNAGQMEIVVAGANAVVYIDVWGYIL